MGIWNNGKTVIFFSYWRDCINMATKCELWTIRWNYQRICRESGFFHEILTYSGRQITATLKMNILLATRFDDTYVNFLFTNVLKNPEVSVPNNILVEFCQSWWCPLSKFCLIKSPWVIHFLHWGLQFSELKLVRIIIWFHWINRQPTIIRESKCDIVEI